MRVEDENDNAPVFSQQSYQVALPELTGPHASVITVNATDKDGDDNARLTYSMVTVDGFYIDRQTGKQDHTEYIFVALVFQVEFVLFHIHVSAFTGNLGVFHQSYKI